MDNKEQIIEECRNLLFSGKNRDDIDNLLKDKGLNPKEMAAIDYVLQPIYIEQEKSKLLINEAVSNIIAGYICITICLLFVFYTIFSGGYISLLVCVPMIYMGHNFITKGKKQQKENKKDFKNYSQFEKIRKGVD